MLFDEFWFIKCVLVRFPLRVRVCLFDWVLKNPLFREGLFIFKC